MATPLPLLLLALASSSVSVASASDTDCDHNGIADAHEIVADPARDANFNAILDRCEGLSVDTLTVSLAAGGTQNLRAELGPGFAGYLYWILGSTAGTSPGLAVGAVTLPLNYDGVGGYLVTTAKKPNLGPLNGTLSFFDAAGVGSASFSLPPGSDPTLTGTVLNHAYLVLTSQGLKPFWASNSVALVLTP